MITSHRPHQRSHIDPMPLIEFGVLIIVVFSVVAISQMASNKSNTEINKKVYDNPAIQGNAFPIYRQSERTLVEYSYAGDYSHIGDCGFDRYGLPESGAAGYCYVSPNGEPSGNTVPGEPHRHPAKEKDSKNQSVDQSDVSTTGSNDVINNQPPGGNNTPPEVPSGIPPEAPPETPPETPPEAPPDTPAEAPQHCNKGGGNGGEGCDPGNHPEKGQDDES